MRTALMIAVAVLLAFGQAASALTLTVSDAACRFVTTHQPSADAEYRPGLDIHGKRVAPADLNSGFTLDPLNELILDITADIAGRLTGLYPRRPYGSGSPLPQPPSEPSNPLPQVPYITTGSVGYIVFENGRLLFNGRPLQDPFEEELAALCRMARRGR